MKPPVHVTVTGAAGQISYALLFRLIAGDLAGPDQPVYLRLLDVPEAMTALKGVAMELEDCASPLLSGLMLSADPLEAFEAADLAFLIGATPRGPGMERRDLLQVNAEIFKRQGQAMNAVAQRHIKVLVVGNPANTNAFIALSNAPRLSPRNFSAMTRLDHNRAVSQLAAHCDCQINEIRKVIIWGNHSTTQFPDLFHARVRDRSAMELIDQVWFRDDFIPTVQQRGASVIQVRGKSSAGSAANAAIGQMRDWILGTAENDWVSMAVYSDGSYAIEEGLIYSFPVTICEGEYSIVQGLPLNDFECERMRLSEAELLAEREMVKDLL